MLNTSEYFAHRAPRYQAALSGCPTARSLDYLPYVAFLLSTAIRPNQSTRVLDAFGGTGFLASGLGASGFQFLVADCCEEMLSNAVNLGVKTHTTNNDFQSVLSEFGPESFDLIVSHGGLHHVVNTSDDGTVNASKSRSRQGRLVETLAQLLAINGLLILADIPEEPPSEIEGGMSSQIIRAGDLGLYIPANQVKQVQAMGLLEAQAPFVLVRKSIEDRLLQPVTFPVPRHFFDHYIAAEAPLGHVAVYPDFGLLDEILGSKKLENIGRINYKAPWVFSCALEAGWYFREKFSFHSPAPKGKDEATELDVARKLEEFLGVRQIANSFAVNWGVTYAAYQRR